METRGVACADAERRRISRAAVESGTASGTTRGRVGGARRHDDDWPLTDDQPLLMGRVCEVIASRSGKLARVRRREVMTLATPKSVFGETTIEGRHE